MMASRLKEGEKAELYVVEADNGFDVSVRGLAPDAALTAWAARWAAKLDLARITADAEFLALHNAPGVTLGHAAVQLPPEAFLQPTREGEKFLQERVLAAAKGGKRIVDLFCGVGTFALCLAKSARVLAVDADGAALAALAAAARATQRLKPLSVSKRDLFRSPLMARELAESDVAVLDPPRVGASRQARELALSKVPRIVYVSCNPQSFAREARLLVEGGYRLGTVVPVDQFVWSSHIELVAELSRA
jgi:23S rRNA (uracil1939-C5)-methyltransferase